ncbi:type II secretion system F family protein [Desulfovibrio inopinatus]|uniref:type II secretion system F family protein n=1 Tax=Desulfovibrio inopinatus TaxID=102109 RepID=UPI0004262949|nr:type II secretion system F family protein [Desulfovibrio inopinatus]
MAKKLYVYNALNENGSSVTGEIEAESDDAARLKVSGLGYIPIKVESGVRATSHAGGRAALSIRLTRVKAQDLILFTKQLRTMLKAGIGVLELLRILEQQTENKKLKYVCLVMADDIRKGASISVAFAKHPSVFSSLYVSMIKAGEAAGSLPEVLDRLIYIIEHENKVKSDIRSAMQYPIIVVLALGVAFFVLLTVVIPNFVNLFKKAKIELPMPTKVALGLYHFLSQYGFFLFIALVAIIVVLRFYIKTDDGKVKKDAFLMHLPVLGSLFIKAAMSRFASIFAILQASGVTALQSMEILSDTIGNAAISREFSKISELLKQGRGISAPLRKAKYFTPMVINMVAIGEETGNLDDMMNAVATHYDDEVKYAVSNLSEALGPFLVVGLAAVVGFFALAIFMPMWDMTKMVKM